MGTLAAVVTLGLVLAVVWSGRRDDPGGLGRSDVAVGTPAPRAVATDPGGPDVAAPAGCVVGGREVALGDAGCRVWQAAAPADARWRAVAASDDVVVATTSTGARGLATADGAGRWTWDSPHQVDPSAPPVIAGDVVAIPLRLPGIGPLGGVAVLDLGSGAPRWTAASGPRPVRIAVDAATNAVVSVSTGVVHTRELDTGAPRWQRHLPGLPVADVGLAGGHVIVHAGDAVVALGLDDGQERWRVTRPDAIALLGADDVVALVAPDGVTGLDAASGATRWRLDRAGVRSVTPTGDGTRLVVATADQLLPLDPATGDPDPSVDTPGPLGAVTAAGGRAVHVATPGGLRRIDLAGSRATWMLLERELPPDRYAETSVDGATRLVAVLGRGDLAAFAPPG
ncbi:MAG: PQQ-like beta-propeller repeat protein [Actinobacteria bacterium]|nr:PQQ-like beta-propeller repeat protein [Actinomycetota bacterium]